MKRIFLFFFLMITFTQGDGYFKLHNSEEFFLNKNERNKSANLKRGIVYNIGVKSGLSIFNGEFIFSPDYYPVEIDLKYRLGPFLALSSDFLKLKIISQSLQLHYYQSGGRLEAYEYDDSLQTPLDTYYVDNRFDYIGICYTINLFPPLKTFLPYISIGPHFDFLISNKSVIKEEDKEVEGFKYKELNKFNFGLLITSGIEFPIKNIRIFSEYSYLFNFTPFFYRENSPPNSGARHTTRGHFIDVGVKYLFKD